MRDNMLPVQAAYLLMRWLSARSEQPLTGKSPECSRSVQSVFHFRGCLHRLHFHILSDITDIPQSHSTHSSVRQFKEIEAKGAWPKYYSSILDPTALKSQSYYQNHYAVKSPQSVPDYMSLWKSDCNSEGNCGNILAVCVGQCHHGVQFIILRIAHSNVGKP